MKRSSHSAEPKPASRRFFFDTEFIEDGQTIELISIGIKAEDGREYYAESSDCNIWRASPWVVANVVPHLKGNGIPRAQIAAEIVEFVGAEPEFWAYYSAYDWVVLCQLYGRMIDLPKGWPMWCRDLKQLCEALGNPELAKQTSGEHNALADAIWTEQRWRDLQGLSRSSSTEE